MGRGVPFDILGGVNKCYGPFCLFRFLLRAPVDRDPAQSFAYFLKPLAQGITWLCMGRGVPFDILGGVNKCYGPFCLFRFLLRVPVNRVPSRSLTYFLKHLVQSIPGLCMGRGIPFDILRGVNKCCGLFCLFRFLLRVLVDQDPARSFTYSLKPLVQGITGLCMGRGISITVLKEVNKCCGFFFLFRFLLRGMVHKDPAWRSTSHLKPLLSLISSLCIGFEIPFGIPGEVNKYVQFFHHLRFVLWVTNSI